jgi:RNA polymerase II elongation factor ELL
MLRRVARGMVNSAGLHFRELTIYRSKLANGGPKNGKLLPTGRSAMASVLSSTTTRSLPSSPALNGVASPNPAFSASQQVLEKNKGQRTVLVHELAVRDQPYEHLKDVWMGPDSDLKPTVEKVADFNRSTEKWSLKKIYWKELDVWNYDYDSSEDRQSAIDNAIKAYDKQRVGTSDPVWDRLLRKEDRGKGIILSKLQATIAKKTALPPAPKIAMQKTEDGNKSDMDSSKAKGEAMSRSNSQPSSGKPKKVSEREAQTKRLLSNNPKKPAPKKPAAKAKATEEKGKKVLSEEFVYDTDTSQEETPLSQSTTTATQKPSAVRKPATKPVAKSVEKPIEKTIEKPVEKPTTKSPEKPVARVNDKPKESVTSSGTLKAKPKPVVRAPRAPVKAPVTNISPQKRTREDDDSSSSSGAPLSKRLKPKEAPKLVAKPLDEPKRHRLSDASQNSRATTNSTISPGITMARNKNTSPTKSSPLATSPPTNASDLDDHRTGPRPTSQSQQVRVSEKDRGRERDRGQTNGAIKSLPASSAATHSASNSTKVGNKKRKEREPVDESPETTPTPPTKKPRVSKEILMRARKFSQFYKKYEALHYEIAALEVPPDDKLADLIEMRNRLASMKRDIQRAVASENEE